MMGNKATMEHLGLAVESAALGAAYDKTKKVVKKRRNRGMKSAVAVPPRPKKTRTAKTTARKV